MSRVRYFAESRLVAGLLLAARFLPRRPLLAVGGWAGSLARRIDRRHARITRANLQLALGRERTADELDRIARACWRNLGRNVVDTLFFPGFGPHSEGTLVEYKGLDHVRAAYAAGQGALMFSAHLGHWELAAYMQAHLGLPLTLVTRRLDNPDLERLLLRFRSASGNRVVHKQQAAREMTRVLRRGGAVAIVIDQDARWGGIFVPFFGRLASTTPTLARLALRTEAAVIPTHCVPLPRGRYRVTYEAPLRLERTADPEADVLRLTATCTAIVERWVRAHPEHWLWMHRRWKTAPPEARAGGGEAGALG